MAAINPADSSPGSRFLHSILQLGPEDPMLLLVPATTTAAVIVTVMGELLSSGTVPVPTGDTERGWPLEAEALGGPCLGGHGSLLWTFPSWPAKGMNQVPKMSIKAGSGAGPG